MSARVPLAAAALAAAALCLSGCVLGTGAPPSATPAPTSTTTPLTSVEAGECFDPATPDAVTLVDCAGRHRYEVFATLLVPDAEYPAGTLKDSSVARCQDAFADFIGVEFAASRIRLRVVMPSEDTWDEGDREVLCIVGDPSGSTTGTLANSAR